MPTITLTITIDVPEGVEVAVSTATQEAVAQIVPRLRDAVGEIAADLAGRESPRWNRGEHALAEDTTLTDEQLAERVGRSAGAVHAYRLHHGIIKPSKIRNIKPVERAMAKWTVAEVDMLREYAGNAAAQEVADALGRSRDSVREKAKNMGFIERIRDWK
jgi:hypothetical protein